LEECLSVSGPFGKSDEGREVVVDDFIFSVFVLSDLSDTSELADLLLLNKSWAISDNHFFLTVSDSQKSLFVLSNNLNNQVLILGVNTSWNSEQDSISMKESSGEFSQVSDILFHGAIFLQTEIQVRSRKLIFCKIFILNITMQQGP
jgi:hypothetical protein